MDSPLRSNSRSNATRRSSPPEMLRIPQPDTPTIRRTTFQTGKNQPLTIGNLIPDLIVEGKLIVDPKVVTAFNDSHFAQMLGYLNITGLKTALFLNFKYTKLGIKRVSN